MLASSGSAATEGGALAVETGIAAPVTKSDAGLARNATAKNTNPTAHTFKGEIDDA